jgi:hypothetical protein
MVDDELASPLEEAEEARLVIGPLEDVVRLDLDRLGGSLAGPVTTGLAARADAS